MWRCGQGAEGLLGVGLSHHLCLDFHVTMRPKCGGYLNGVVSLRRVWGSVPSLLQNWVSLPSALPYYWSPGAPFLGGSQRSSLRSQRVSQCSEF